MIILALVLLLLALGAPLFVVLGLAGLASFGLYVEGYETFFSLDLAARKIAELTQQNIFLAIPFFVVSGSIMSAGGIARRLVGLAEALVGWMRGGMAIAAIAACVIFASLSGSSPVTLIAIGGLMYPAMVKQGYRDQFALGLVTTAGSLGCLVPPSVPMLVYSISVSGTAAIDVRDLFMAGLGPALLIVGMLSIYSFFRSGKVSADQAFSLERLRLALRDGAWALLLPLIILGGIYSGLFTPTEAASVSVAYALFVEFVIHRELRVEDLPKIIVEAVQSMGALVLIIMLSLLLNQFMVEKQLGEAVLERIRSWGLGPIGFLMAMNVFLVVTGMLMDSISAIVLFTPLIVPTAVALGLDPLHVGIVFIVNMEIGYLAPPIATNLFVASSIFKKPFGEVTRAVLPTLGLMLLGLLVVTYLPSASTGPVHALKGEGFLRPLVTGGPLPGLLEIAAFLLLAVSVPLLLAGLRNWDWLYAGSRGARSVALLGRSGTRYGAAAVGGLLSVGGLVVLLSQVGAYGDAAPAGPAAATRPADPAPDAAPRVRSLEEMMKAARAAPAPDAPAAPARVLSLEEMMKAAREKAAQEAAAASAPPAPAP